MKSLAALCLLALAGCATTPSTRAMHVSEATSEGGGGPGGPGEELTAPSRIETPAGTFLVSPGHAEDFARALAGESTSTRFYAGADR